MKAHVAFVKILEDSTAAQGDQIRTMGSYANQMKQLRANMENIGATLGEAVLPQLTEFVNLINDGIKNNPQVIQDIAEFTKNIFNLTKTLGEAAGAGIRFANVWVKTWQALGLASGGVISWTTALTDGASAVDMFNTEAGRLELQLVQLNDKIARNQSIIDLAERFEQTNKSAVALQESLLGQKAALEEQIASAKQAASEQELYNKIQEDGVKVSTKAAEGTQEVVVAVKELTKAEQELGVDKKLVEYFDEIDESAQRAAAASAKATETLHAWYAVVGEQVPRDSWLIQMEDVPDVAQRVEDALVDLGQTNDEVTEAMKVLWEDFVSQTGLSLKTLSEIHYAVTLKISATCLNHYLIQCLICSSTSLARLQQIRSLMHLTLVSQAVLLSADCLVAELVVALQLQVAVLSAQPLPN